MDRAPRTAATLGLMLGGLVLGACAPDLNPTWAADTLHLQPGLADDGMVGFATWTLYGPGFEKAGRERHFACAVVVELALEPCAAPTCVPCQDCTHAWTTQALTRDSDCEGAPALPDLHAVALGPLADDLIGDERAPAALVGTWTRYDDSDWLAHGWADFGDSEPDPIPATPTVTGWPAWAWPLDDAPP